jgi:hypothetical protein
MKPDFSNITFRNYGTIVDKDDPNYSVSLYAGGCDNFTGEKIWLTMPNWHWETMQHLVYVKKLVTHRQIYLEVQRDFIDHMSFDEGVMAWVDRYYDEHFDELFPDKRRHS